MKYNSTRDNSVAVTSAEAIVKGLSAEGGLYIPDGIPAVSMEAIAEMADMSYTDRAKKILGLFLTDFKASEVEDCVTKAYTKEKFGTASIAPVYKLDKNRYVLELWHGPTCAFKDMALQILPHLLTTSVKKTGMDREIVILVATSGDTGKAALEGFKDVEGTKIIVFYPESGVSGIQKLQMCTQDGGNVFVSAVNGNFDDAQTGVKKIFTDKEYARELDEKGISLSSANSINWGRLAPQIVYYFSAYCDMLRGEEIKAGEQVNICVPTGNFGNILAAYYAKLMGLPVKTLICASNSNNVLTDFINTGVYDRNREFYTTISPSMDILISSNLERLLYLLSDRNDREVAGYMDELKSTGKYAVSGRIFDKVRESFRAGFADDGKCRETIRRVQDEFGYVIDPHTSVAVTVHEEYAAASGDDTKTIIASTASPFKFNGDVLTALLGKEEVEDKDEFELLRILAERYELTVPPSLGELEDKDVRFETVCDKAMMKAVVNEFLG